MANSVVHFEINGTDGPALQKFYGDLFDWEITSDNPMGYGVVSAPSDGPGIGGGIMGMGDVVPPPGSRSTWAWTTCPSTWRRPRAWAAAS